MINLTAEKLPNGGLKITIDEDGRAELRQWQQENPDAFDSERTLHDAFEGLVCNSDYDWCEPEQIGALTDAPILALYGDPIAVPIGGADYSSRSG